MNVARILYPVEVLGPGKRVGIWVCGCHRACRGCSNPELWNTRPEYEVPVDEIVRLIEEIAAKYAVDGFTITGGEPMDQADDLSCLLHSISRISGDILIYTGYHAEDLQKWGTDAVHDILTQAAVIVDGEYIEEKNTGVVLRGSENQRILMMNPDFRKRYESYLLTAHNQIQNFTTSSGVVSVGIHHKGF